MIAAQEGPKKRLVYCTNVTASFSRNDVLLLREHFDLKYFHFSPGRKIFTPVVLLRQLIFLIRNLPNAHISVTQFAGYHSVLPVMLGKLLSVPALLVLGGTECVKFPSFGYGDHTRWPYGFLVRWSLRNAKHLAPVDASLVESRYVYSPDPRDPTVQGYRGLFPDILTPYTILQYGYDPERFKPMGERMRGTFLTVSRMNAPNFYRKGADLIFAMAERFPSLEFTILGDTEGMSYPPVPSNLKLVRSVPYEDLPAYYASHEFYLQLSMWEGFPSAPCEAMLCGCIPIVSSVAALPEIVGDTGFILQTKDLLQLETLIAKALDSDSSALGVRARNRIMNRWPPNARNKFLELVNTLSK
ncbi:MAG: glycosyltransferase family 4 protein [Flavobacteriales bacterium]|nr:glycosyltransferase family 4 protein [Flavobacteriales bacterium]